MTRHVVVTGTDTGVGKTVATAAIASALSRDGSRVVVVKPVQTGVTGDEAGDTAEVARLAGVPTRELLRLAPPLAPESAARLLGRPLPTVAEHAAAITAIAADVVVTEGAGGLRVRLDHAGGTIGDLARLLGAEVLVVTREGLGTLNHTQLTVDALRASGIEPRLVIGSVAPDPDLAAVCNRDDLPRVTGCDVVGRIPAGAGTLDREAFTEHADRWLPGL